MIKKGQWVEFNLRNEITKGCVIKGGKNLTVAYGHTTESYRTVKGSASHFKLIQSPNLDDSGIMDAYELKSYKEAGGEETVRFEAKLCYNGKQIAIVSNGGFGGCNAYHPTKGATWHHIEAYYEAVKQWAIHYGDENPFEPESSWINWITSTKQTGMSAKLYWDDHNEYMKKLNKK
jgi:hypothetical protein